jgi:hypothetical protein
LDLDISFSKLASIIIDYLDERSSSLSSFSLVSRPDFETPPIPGVRASLNILDLYPVRLDGLTGPPIPSPIPAKLTTLITSSLTFFWSIMFKAFFYAETCYLGTSSSFS